MSNLLKKANEIYLEVLETFPYCSASIFYLLDERIPHSRFGGSCILQSKMLYEKFKGGGIEDVSYIREGGFGPNFSLIVSIEGNLYFASVYLMLPQLINLSEIRHSSTKMAIFEAYPYLNGEASKVSITFEQSGRKFRVMKSWPGSTRVDDFTYDIDSEENRYPSPHELKSLVYGPHRKDISLRLLDRSNGRVTHLVHPIKSEPFFSLESIYIKTNDNFIIPFNDENFQILLHQMGHQLGLMDNDLIEFLIEGLKLFWKHHPGKR